LGSSGGRGGYMKGFNPGGGNRPYFVIIVLGLVS
jgi:hypothetical protein